MRSGRDSNFSLKRPIYKACQGVVFWAHRVAHLLTKFNTCITFIDEIRNGINHYFVLGSCIIAMIYKWAYLCVLINSISFCAKRSGSVYIGLCADLSKMKISLSSDPKLSKASCAYKVGTTIS